MGTDRAVTYNRIRDRFERVLDRHLGAVRFLDPVPALSARAGLLDALLGAIRETPDPRDEQIATLTRERDGLKSAVVGLQHQVAMADADLADLRGEVATLTAALTANEAHLGDACEAHALEKERLRGLLTKTAGERDTLKSELTAARAEADRLRHGQTIEGDHICPDALRADAAEAEAAALKGEVERLTREIEVTKEIALSRMATGQREPTGDWFASEVAARCLELFAQHPEACNYVEMKVCRKGEAVPVAVVIVKRVEGKSPHDLREDAERTATSLRERLARLEGMLREIADDRPWQIPLRGPLRCKWCSAEKSLPGRDEVSAEAEARWSGDVGHDENCLWMRARTLLSKERTPAQADSESGGVVPDGGTR